jgi:thiamine-phosphate pyrophosphorylase
MAGPNDSGGGRRMLCLVTDRRRLSPGQPVGTVRRRLLDQVRWAVSIGVDLVQVRERDLDAAGLADLVNDLVGICHGSGTRVTVNERADVALGCGADGVHLRHDSIPAARLRSIAPAGFLIGRSVHSPEEAREAGPVDYLFAGTVLETRSKPDARTIGLGGLAAIVRAAAVPVLGIGGLSAGALGDVAGTGAAGIAGIGTFIEWFDTRKRPF